MPMTAGEARDRAPTLHWLPSADAHGHTPRALDRPVEDDHTAPSSEHDHSLQALDKPVGDELTGLAPERRCKRPQPTGSDRLWTGQYEDDLTSADFQGQMDKTTYRSTALDKACGKLPHSAGFLGQL